MILVSEIGLAKTEIYLHSNTVQRKCWMDNIKEWTSLPMPELLIRASFRKDWKRISFQSSLMSPRWPNQSKDWTELNPIYNYQHQAESLFHRKWIDLSRSFGHYKMIVAQTLTWWFVDLKEESSVLLGDWPPKRPIAKQKAAFLPRYLQIIVSEIWTSTINIIVTSIVQLQTKSKWAMFYTQYSLPNWLQSLITAGEASLTNKT